jgi:nucleoid-associated protein YgaU
MRRARILLLFLLLVVGALGFFGMRAGWFETERSGPGRTVADAPGAGVKTEAANQEKELARPTFDIVRAEPDGSIIMAGQSKPGSTVIVRSNGKEVGRATADDNGEWIVQPEQKLAKGEHSLELSAKSPDEDRTLFSRQRLALSLADAKAGQPLVALTEEGRATRVLQMPPPRTDSTAAAASPSPPEPPAAQVDIASVKPDAEAANVGFVSVDYEDAGEKSMIFMNGHAKPDTRVAVYVDNQLAGTATADATGRWSYSGNRQLKGGSHVIRADLLADEGNSVIARAEVNFERTPPASTALLEDDAKIKGPAGDEPVTLASRPDLGVSAAAAAPAADAQEPSVIVIRRGDTLWQIAQRHYGDGTKYTQIFKNNREQIRNPNWIYPEQRFKLP